MAKPSKAQIKYMVGKGEEAVESILRFHTVIVEEHEVTAEITKFPVQSGFDISNHAIKKNRKVSITGAVSNHLIIGAEEFHEYGGNNSRVMFSALNALVRGAVPCEVQTNLDTYTPVVFTKFKTKQAAGKTDILEFTMVGEELQLGLTVNQTAPTPLVFTPLSPTDAEARRAELLGAGILVPLDAIITEANVDFNKSFQVDTKDGQGNSSTTTFETCSYDPTAGNYSHTIHTDNTAVAGSGSKTFINWFAIMQEEAGIQALPNIGLATGIATTSACLLDGAVGLVTDAASDLIETGVGYLKKSIYGAAYGILGVNGNQSAGQVLLSLGVDCLVAGAIGTVDPDLNPDDFQENSIPTVDEVLKGATTIGDSLLTDTLGVSAPSTLTKITTPTLDVDYFGDLI